MLKTEVTRWPRDSNKSASGKPGAVQLEQVAINTGMGAKRNGRN